MYHRVINPNNVKTYIQPGMYVDPVTFAMHLNALTSYFSIISINELMKIAHSGKSDRFSKSLCAITFDDGWVDYYQNAFPLLKEYNLPATVFLPTNFIGSDQWFWTDRFAFIWKNKKLNNNPGSNQIIEKLLGIKGTFPMQIEKGLQILKALPLSEIESVLSEMENAFGMNAGQQGRAFLNWQEVKEMRDSGLVSFGSHTVDHHILTTLSENEIRKELRGSMQCLLDKKVVEKGKVPFCYPNGNFDLNIAQIVKDEGYSCAVTTKTDWNSFSADPFTLNRVGMHQDISSTKSMFLANIAGIF